MLDSTKEWSGNREKVVCLKQILYNWSGICGQKCRNKSGEVSRDWVLKNPSSPIIPSPPIVQVVPLFKEKLEDQEACGYVLYSSASWNRAEREDAASSRRGPWKLSVMDVTVKKIGKWVIYRLPNFILPY